ncbi:VWFA domain-containing protein [Entamoeba marina]
MIYYGTVISQKDLDLVENIDFEIETCGINAKVKAIHHVCNPTDDPLNATITTTFDDETSVIGFSMESDVLVTSELKKIGEAKQDQADATSGGYSSSVMEKTDDTTFSLSLGLLKPHKVIKVTIEYLTKLQTSENMLIVKLPAPIQKKVPFSISITGTTSFKFKGELTGEEEIEIEDKAEGIVVMKDEDTDEMVASSTFVNREEEGDIEVIFVCDRSGSMGGSGIEALRETLQLFLRQLPLVNLILCFQKSKTYDDKVLEQASKKVESFQSNYGGTNMYGPLEQAMKQKCHIIALTDGSLSDKVRVINLCKENKNSVVHSVGLGRNVDIQTVRDMARLTGGISVVSKNPRDLKGAVSRITQRILTPSISGVDIKWSIKGESYPKNIAKMNNDLSVFLSLNEEKEEKLKSLSCTLSGTIGKKKIMLKNVEPKITNGLLLHQLLAAQKIKEAETNSDWETAVKLSLRYNILSRHTAFVAVDKSSKQEVQDIKVVKLEDVTSSYGASFSGLKKCKKKSARTFDFKKKDKVCKKESTISKPPAAPCRMLEEKISLSTEIECEDLLICDAPMEIMPKLDICDNEQNEMKVCKEEVSSRKKQANSKSKQDLSVLSKESNAIETEQLSINKSKDLNAFIKLQKADGRFINVESIYSGIKEIIKKYPKEDKDALQTFFAIQVLNIVFADKKVEWKLLVKKAEKFLSKTKLGDEVKGDIITLVKSL